MKITVPILYFGASGGYRVLSELASQWIRNGHRVSMMVNGSSRSPYFPTEAEIIWLDDDGNRLDSEPLDGKASAEGSGRLPHVLRSLKRGLDRYARDSDVVLANHSLTAWPVSASRVMADKFYYIQAYEPEYYANCPGIRARAWQMLSLGSYLLPMHRIVNAPLYYRHGAIRANQFIPPGLDFRKFFPKDKKSSTDKRPLILGCIGRLEPWKGTRYVLDAFEILLSKGMDVELHVAFGNLPPGRDLGPKCKVVIPQGDAELGEYYRSLDIMIAPGTVQLGAPHYPVMEAMACGIPVVTTGYMPADETNSWLVPVGDAEAIASAVADIADNPEIRDLRVGRAQKAIDRFSWPNVAGDMMKIFQGRN